MKTTQNQIAELLADAGKLGILTNLKGLLTIYLLQTEDEKRIEDTTEFNGVGFSGFDGRILTSISTWFIEKGFVTSGQMRVIRKKMKKYAKQLTKVANGEIVLPQGNANHLLPNSPVSTWVK